MGLYYLIIWIHLGLCGCVLDRALVRFIFHVSVLLQIFLGVGCVLVILLWILDFMFSVIWSYVSCGLVCYLPICKSVCKSKIICLSTGERPFIDILQDRRYWVIHIITIPSLFIAGVIFILSRFVYKLFGLPNFNQYFNKDNTQISLINDRFSSSLEIEDI